MGLGYLYNGKKITLGIILTIAAFGFTYIEQFHVFSDNKTFQSHDSQAFIILFVSVFIANTGLALDAYIEAKNFNSKIEVQ